MPRTRVNGWLTFTILGLVCVGGVGFAQQTARETPAPAKADDKKPAEDAKPADEKASLEDLLAKALKDNPDLRVAETKLREAEAQLNRVRLQVMQKVVAYRHDLDAATKMVDEAQQRLNRILELKKANVVSVEEVQSGELTLLRYKAEKAKLEAELPYLLGKQPTGRGLRNLGEAYQGNLAVPVDDFGRLTLDTPAFERYVVSFAAVDKDVAGRLRKSLGTEVQVDFRDKRLGEILKDLERQVPGVHFFVPSLLSNYRDWEVNKYSLHLNEKLPLAAALQAVEDETGQFFRFAVRDYGILVINRDNYPRGAMSVQEFWRNKPPQAGEPAPNAPAKH